MRSRTPYGEGTGIHVRWVAVRRRTLYSYVILVGMALTLGAGAYLWLRAAVPSGAGDDAVTVEASTGDTSARFVVLDGTVKIRKAGSYEWMDADLSIPLERNDTVRTVGKSSARIRLFDGTEYLVKPDTIFIIETMREDPRTRVREVAVKLTAGQVNLQTPRKNVEGSRSELATPTTEATFDELTVADVTYNESSRATDFAVFRGGTRVRAGGQEVEIGTSQALEVRGEVFSEITRLPGIPVLESPAHLSQLVYADPTRENIELKWKPVDVANRYRVQLDTSAHFIEPQEYKVNRLKVVVPGLRPGTYYWRVSAVDSKNQEGGFCEFAKFTVTRRAAHLEPPPLRLSTPTVSVDGLVTVAGVTAADAVVTVNDERVEVKADGTFQHLFFLDSPGRHPIVVKANKRSGGTSEKTVYVTIGTN